MKNLINRILNWFGRANDWTLVWEDHGVWTVTIQSPELFQTREENRKSIYSIFFSPSLHKYELKLKGYRAVDHTMHLIAKMQLIRFNKDLINIE